jgi:acyl-CoA thioesterase-1
MHAASLAPLLPLLGAVLLCSVAAIAAEAEQPDLTIRGESLVLPGEEPGRLALRPIRHGSVVVRSQYDPAAPGCRTYQEGFDYSVDYASGTVRRLPGSAIPDYRRNITFGLPKFDHNDHPGFGNYRDFIYVDYAHQDPLMWPVQQSQAALLPRTTARLREGRSLSVSAFGDSITAGGDATAPGLIYWERWLTALRRRYPGASIRGENAATGGDTTMHGLHRLEEKVLARKPDLVLVAFGMNDQNVGGVPEPVFRENLELMVERIRSATGAEVILLSSILPNPAWKYTSGRMEAYGRLTEEVARAKACAFADVLGNWKTFVDRKKHEDLLANNVNHPNDFGHWIYYQVLEQLGL